MLILAKILVRQPNGIDYGKFTFQAVTTIGYPKKQNYIESMRGLSSNFSKSTLLFGDRNGTKMVNNRIIVPNCYEMRQPKLMKELGYGVKNINIRIDYDNNFGKIKNFTRRN
jgi:hypothetical protein